LAFANRQLDFYRVKTVPKDPEKIFQEINRSIVGYRRAHASFSRSTIHLHSDWGELDELREAVHSAFERELELLPSPLSHLTSKAQLAISSAEACGMAAALGVAERMIQRVTK
jgi:type IV pilus assembly protein PilM